MAKNITGTLKYLESGQLVTDWGEGNFLALKFTNNNPDKIKTIKVGLDPSQGSGLVPLDEDMNGVFKITDKDTQKFVVESYDEEDKLLSRDEYSLDELWCNSKEVKLNITSEVQSSYVRGVEIPVSFEYDLKDIVEPENAVIKIGYRDDYNDTFIGDITPQTASGVLGISVNTIDMPFVYNTDIVVAVTNTDGTLFYKTDRTNEFEITEPPYVFNSDVITDGGEYDRNYFAAPRQFTVSGMTEDDEIYLEYEPVTNAPVLQVNGSIDESGIYNGTISGVNQDYTDYTMVLYVNDVIVCTFIIDGKRNITLDTDEVTIGVGETTTVGYTPVNFGANALFVLNESGSASATLDTENKQITITGNEAGLGTIGLSGYNNGVAEGTPDVHVTITVTIRGKASP